MKCPICVNGVEPQYIFNVSDEVIKEHMKKDYSVKNIEGHLLWGHPHIDVVKLLMKYIIKEESNKVNENKR